MTADPERSGQAQDRLATKRSSMYDDGTYCTGLHVDSWPDLGFDESNPYGMAHIARFSYGKKDTMYRVPTQDCWFT